MLSNRNSNDTSRSSMTVSLAYNTVCLTCHKKFPLSTWTSYLFTTTGSIIFVLEGELQPFSEVECTLAAFFVFLCLVK